MPYANFACVLGLTQSALQDMVHIAYAEGEIPHWFKFDEEAASLFKVAADLFSDIPQFLFTSTEPNAVRISIMAWGPMQIGLPVFAGGAMTMAIEEREVLFEALLQARHQMSIDNAELVFGIDATTLTILSKSITVLSGGPFSTRAQSLLDSSVFENMLQAALRDRFGEMANALPSINIRFLEPLVGLPLSQEQEGEDSPPLRLYASGRAFDQAVMIGIDFEQSGFGTSGNPILMTDDTRGFEFVAWANPLLWVDNMKTELLEGPDAETPGIREQVESAGAELLDFELTLHEGYLHGAGSAAHDPYGSVDFSYDVYARLTRPRVYENLGQDELGYPIIIDIPAREELWFEVVNVDVDVNAAGWLRFVEVVVGISTLGVAALAFESFVNMVRFNVEAQISQGDTPGSNREHVFRSTPGGPPIRGKLNAFEFHSNGVFVGLSLSIDFPTPGIFSTTHPYPRGWNFNVVDIEELWRSPLVYSVQLPPTVLLDDPKLRIRWTVRSEDGDILQEEDGPALEHELLTVAAAGNVDELRIACRVYRTMGATITDVFNGTFTTRLYDRLDKSHPFVRWFHHVYTPDVRVESDGSQTLVGAHIKYRKSKIHRTDFPGRCRMASRYSLSSPRGFRVPPSRATRLEYLDDLPFPIDSRNRDMLCDYCFFGGPTSTIPLRFE